jgi:hypothetical protein
VTRQQAKDCGKLAKGLWPAATIEQIGAFTDTLEPFKFDRALAVIKTNAASEGHEFFSLPKLVEALRADRAKHANLSRERNNERIVDWCRPENYGPDELANMNDEQVLLYHFGTCRTAVEHSGQDPRSIAEVLQIMHGHARAAFMQLGFMPERVVEALDALGFAEKAMEK